MSTRSTSRSPGILREVLGVVLVLVVTCAVAAVLQGSFISALASTGVIRGPNDPGRATAIEAWLVHNWPVLVIVELIVGFFIARRVCRPVFRGKRSRLLPNTVQQPPSAPSGARG